MRREDDEIDRFIHASLLDEVTPNMRGISYKVEGNCVVLQFILDSPVTESDRDQCSCIAAEVVSFLTHDWRIREECVCVPIDEPIMDKGIGDWIYRRKWDPA